MMFIVEFREEMRQAGDKHIASQWQALKELGREMIGRWRKIAAPTPAIQEQVWEFLYKYTRGAVAQILLRGKTALGDEEEVKTPMQELISLLYPRENHAAEIFGRIVFIAERALVAVKPGDHDRYSPLDSMRAFRRMLGRHLWESEEMLGTLKQYRKEYAVAVLHKLREVEFEQSRYDSWETSYLECERRYHQILNRIGEIERPSAPICNPRSAWELRAQVKDWAELHLSPIQTSPMEYSWRFCQQLRNAVNRDRADAAQHLDLNYKNRRGLR